MVAKNLIQHTVSRALDGRTDILQARRAYHHQKLSTTNDTKRKTHLLEQEEEKKKKLVDTWEDPNKNNNHS